MTKKLWFKRKRFGWGWFPASWEGWLVTLAFLAFIVTLYLWTSPESIQYYVMLVLAVIILIQICYRTGEKPKWSWGN